MLTHLKLSVSYLLLTSAAHALILYSGDNSANQTAPANGAPFETVARVCNNGGSSVSGSAVYIRGKYMLTANHVSNRDYVTFDGSTYWERDTSFTPITIGTADVKLFKLIKDPGLNEVELQTTSDGNDVTYTTGFGKDRETVEVTGTMVGWGKGTTENGSGFVEGDDQTWTWANNYAKRWGTNQIDSTSIISNIANYNYSYTSLVIDLDTDAGTDEAALAVYDSGSGIFVENNGIWRLAGIATLVQTNGSSTFSSTAPELNYYVRIENIASAIEAEIPDLSTYAGWKIDNSLYDSNALDTADIDFDGIPQLHEFAFGGDPNENDLAILPTHTFVEDAGSTYLELSVTRPIGLQNITYTPQTATDLSVWPDESTGITNTDPTPVDNGDNTETLTYRRSGTISAVDKAFIRVNISEAL